MIAVYSVVIDRDYRTLRHLPLAIVAIAPLSYFYNFVVLLSIWKEFRSEPELWTKIERVPSGAAARRGGVSLALLGVLLIGLAAVMQFSTGTDPSGMARTRGSLQASKSRSVELAVATHFDAWKDWRSAVSSVVESPGAHLIQTVGVSAGRLEWAHFRWDGHQAQWSTIQKNESADVLGGAVHIFRQRGFRTVAIVDVYAPKLLKDEPEKAAVRFDGMRSADQVCFTELVDGDYGQRIVEMVAYLARNYPVDAISLTELGYNSFCFDDRCLVSYRNETKRTAWPTNRAGTIADRNDPSVWEWRSIRMEAFLARIARVAHAAGKQLLVDVPVNWDDFRRYGKDSGLDYARILRHADQIVVWNYFGIDGRSPRVSQALAATLGRDFPAGRVSISIGMWGPHGTIDSETLQEGLVYTLKGGASNIWITPNHFLSQNDWAASTTVLGDFHAENGVHN